MIFKGFIDESFNREWFSLSCLMSDLKEWIDFERDWKNYLWALNKKLRAQGRRQISRYHAADCSSRRGEFEGWTSEEQIDLTKELLAIFNRSRIMNVVAYSMPLNDFVRVFPEHAADPIEACYVELLKFMMLEITDQFVSGERKMASEGRRVKALRIVLFHDRSRYDALLSRTFDRVMADPTFDGTRYFSTINARSWEDCILLQGADLIAYETFKDVQRLDKSKRRKTLELLLQSRSFGGRSRNFTLDSIKMLREAYVRFGTTPPTT